MALKDRINGKSEGGMEYMEGGIWRGLLFLNQHCDSYKTNDKTNF